jgi:hypothetical protein
MSMPHPSITDNSTDYDLTDRQVFPRYSSALQPAAKNSALTRIREKRALKKAATGALANFP